MNATLTRMIHSTSFTVFLLVVGVLCLAIHFEIYRPTLASAFINQTELYFARRRHTNTDEAVTPVYFPQFCYGG